MAHMINTTELLALNLNPPPGGSSIQVKPRMSPAGYQTHPHRGSARIFGLRVWGLGVWGLGVWGLGV